MPGERCLRQVSDCNKQDRHIARNIENAMILRLAEHMRSDGMIDISDVYHAASELRRDIAKALSLVRKESGLENQE